MATTVTVPWLSQADWDELCTLYPGWKMRRMDHLIATRPIDGIHTRYVLAIPLLETKRRRENWLPWRHSFDCFFFVDTSDDLAAVMERAVGQFGCEVLEGSIIGDFTTGDSFEEWYNCV